MNMFKPNIAKDPEEYIAMIDEPRKSNIRKLHELIKKVIPDEEIFMISGMIGYGRYHYKTAAGREGDWCKVALASQKNYISVYVCASDGERYIPEKYKDKLPKANIGRSCVRFKKVEDISTDVLEEMILEGMKTFKA